MIWYIILSNIIYALADNLNWLYYNGANLPVGESSKLLWMAFGLSCVLIGFKGSGNLKRYLIVWLLFHFPIQQLSCGLIRQGNPLYLGVGWFDQTVRFMTGNAWWFYLIVLLASLFVGFHMIYRKDIRGIFRSKYFEYIFIYGVITLVVMGLFTFVIVDNFFVEASWYIGYKNVIAEVMRWMTVLILVDVAIALASIKLETNFYVKIKKL